MTDEKRLYRSREALVAGVCAGIADYFNVDPLVVRILAIVGTFASGGVLALAYVGLWIALPTAPEAFAPLDVEPQVVRSDTYGTVGCGESRAPEPPRPAVPASMAGRSASSYSGSGHVPPEPPPAVAWAQPPAAGGPSAAPHAGAAPSWGAASFAAAASRPGGAPYFDGAAWPDVVPQPQVAPQPQGPRADVASPQPHAGPQQHAGPQLRSEPQPGFSGQPHPASKRRNSSASVMAALIAGSLLLSAGIGVLASEFVADVSWWQCWPLVLVILGILRMVLPDAEGWRLEGFARGLVLFSVGATLVPMSLGIVAWHTLGAMCAHLWPLLCIALGCLVLGFGFKSSGLKLVAALAFAAFCAVGVLWFGIPGPVGELVLLAPYGREYRFPFFG